ncbi:MAG: VWA domain-containing protein [Deltaproteobacteria bacterium]|nr:VWA domain-containing protein [Deltaproteobacteria bacterium]
MSKARLVTVMSLFAAACGASQGDAGDGSSNDPFRSGKGGTSGQLTGGSGYFVDNLANPKPGSGSGSGSGDEKFCDQKEFKLNRLPPEILLVLDRSGSMRQDAQGKRGTPSKWTQTIAAIDTTLASTEAGVYWGLKLFPSWKGSNDNECSTGGIAGVDPALTQHAQLMTVVNANGPGEKGRTPTAKAVTEAAALLGARTTANPKFLLLATDGIPNCRSATDNGNDVEGAVAAVAAARDAGFATFVVGIAAAGIEVDGVDPFAVLNQMAMAGGRPRDGEIKFFSAGSEQELTSALGTIASQAAECTFNLGQVPPAPENIAVELNGTRLTPADWSYGAGNRSVIIKGSWCDKLKKGDVTQAQVKFGCTGQVIL